MKKLLTTILFFVLLLPSTAFAAIAFDKAGAGQDTNSASVSLAAAATNEVAVIFVMYQVSSCSFSSLTVGGSSTGVTQMGTEFTNGDSVWHIRSYYIYNPPTSSTAYTFTTTGAGCTNEMQVLLYSGANSTQPDSYSSGMGTVPITLTTTVVAAGSWLVSAVVNRVHLGITAGTGTVKRVGDSADQFGSGDSNGTVGTGSQSMGWTGPAGTTQGGPIISLAIAAPPATPTSILGLVWAYFF